MSDTSPPAEALIGRALHAQISEALRDSEIRVDMERASAIQAHELPCVQLFWTSEEVVAAFIGGREMVMARYSAECIADVGEGEVDAIARPAESTYSAMVLLQQCRDAVLADRTLGGAAVSLETSRGDPGRATINDDITTARSDALVISIYFLRERS